MAWWYLRRGASFLVAFLIIKLINCFRILLNSGGDDITEFLYVLLQKISFPYKVIDLTRSYDWNLMEDLKARLCTLLEVCLYYRSANVYLKSSGFAERCSSKLIWFCCTTAGQFNWEVWSSCLWRSYFGTDGKYCAQTIPAFMLMFRQCLFLPSVVNFDQKRLNALPMSSADVTDGIPESIADRIVRNSLETILS